ncbi:OmpA family protein [Urechidicola croceus]|uniref:Cell envelope biogenesis protein OmpA n=1 Tax=Urechidicola croceus TaxID=1850246 RepID=A0A1D8P9J0_9FLAO|nr:OmpA family protein [Urechidicola croceus]AOW21203.1 cell envelope biogenesis protein OmpA [Urechidicola croceus]
MKHLRIALLALLVVAGFSNVNAQDENNPWAVGFGINAVDFFPTNHTQEGIGQWYSQFGNADAHYNIIPSISRISVGKYLDAGFSFELAGTLNRISKIGDVAADDLTYFGIDGAIKYDINNLIGDTKWFDPFASLGGGYTWIDSKGAGTVNGGLGANLWLNDSFGFNIQTAYKHAFEDDNVIPHWQHAAGVVVRFGGTDTDGDGIYDKEDACPEVFGLEEFNGCPDTDSDGIIDSEDACPDVAGLAELNGCPDADGDGIADGDDACPNEKGSKANNGCPDTDGDGVVDGDDACPSEAGPAANKGCPWTDKDGDGVLDKDDKCPDVAGVASNNGCPEEILTVEAEKQIGDFARTILFNTGRSTFKPGITNTLDAVAAIMTEFDKANFHIEGHTDSTGSNRTNQRLSDSRANAVRDYLISKGISAARLSAAGYGEDRPIDSNETSAGRANNRRVEINLVK